MIVMIIFRIPTPYVLIKDEACIFLHTIVMHIMQIRSKDTHFLSNML